MKEIIWKRQLVTSRGNLDRINGVLREHGGRDIVPDELDELEG